MLQLKNEVKGIQKLYMKLWEMPICNVLFANWKEQLVLTLGTVVYNFCSDGEVGIEMT